MLFFPQVLNTFSVLTRKWSFGLRNLEFWILFCFPSYHHPISEQTQNKGLHYRAYKMAVHQSDMQCVPPIPQKQSFHSFTTTLWMKNILLILLGAPSSWIGGKTNKQTKKSSCKHPSFNLSIPFMSLSISILSLLTIGQTTTSSDRRLLFSDPKEKLIMLSEVRGV